MSKTARCILTAKDFTILEVLLDRRVNKDEFFVRLLRQKLSKATVVFQEDLGPQVATINSRVDFTVEGQFSDNRILVHGGDDAYPGLCLSIMTLRGLALLGLTAGEAIVVERSDDQTEKISLDAVSYQPNAADRRNRLHRQSLLEAGSPVDVGSPVVSLASRRKAAPTHRIDEPIDPDDDDPGPRAA
ncbi:regulator of nucleoside diphosphate kinase [Nitrobacteraceae bacterium AZCC 1564]